MRILEGWETLSQQKQAAVMAFLGSLILSLLAFYSDPVINRDGMLYIDMARSIAEHGGNVEQFNWPFFSYFLAGVISISPFSDTVTSMMVVSLFSAGATALLAVLLGSMTAKRFVFLAVLVALAFPGFNDNRAQILRDWPAWFFSLGAIYAVIRFDETLRWRYALAGVALLLMGMLCRLEVAGLGMALGLAWGLKGGRRKLLVLGSLVVTAMLVGLWYAFEGDFGERIRLYLDALDVVARYQEFMTISQKFADTFIHEYSREYGGLVLFVGLVSIIPAQLLALLGPYLLALFMGKATLPDREKRIYGTVFVIWFLILVVFLTAYFLLSSRYVVLLALVVMPWLFLRFAQGYENGSAKWRSVAVFVLAMMALTGSYSSSAREKMSLVQAGHWLIEQNSPVVYFNDPRISFYAGRTYFMSPMEQPDAVASGEFLVWLVDRDDMERLIDENRVSLRVVEVFDSGGDDVVLVMAGL
ncbi:ArnT family glycosyltransferase [Alcanivorax sp. IL3]|uniref:ArnT family glycosyltransferase n=1 Tax=Alcanivorax sp. IL3 TaxID=3396309 RepID=UPI0039C2DC35